uniref:Thioredoxin domain-containing protein n=1 Tax=Bicosoecida sp. CB-2014 TaxID=1486930 RepID=A0A7S1CI66_9STRA|mmetsp:Transcript_27742/g.96008  ORF Transcript_27742/g.96008 Transcript_27742/m.96008 type:complete len:144 (+) Transcript_27742:190-621(+)
MKPAWDQLGDEFASSSSVVVGDVDCTVHQDLCSKHEVRGYPTIKYYKQGEDAESYQGGRDFDSLKAFVVDTLQVACQIDDQSGCTDKEVKYIAKMQAAPAAKVAAQIERLEGMKGDKMKPDLKQWLFQRLNILTQIAGSNAEL